MTIAVQRDSPVGGRAIIDSEFLATGHELSASRRCANDPDAVVLAILCLMSVTENGEPDFGQRLQVL